jgi:alkaline phosphatase
MKFKKQFAAVIAGAVAAASLAGCATQQSPASEPPASTQSQAAEAAMSAEPVSVQAETSVPKYVFLFIGDGMSYVQFQTASDYLGAVADPDADILQGGEELSFMSFPVAGSATTYDSTSFCPDSASTATSIASGHKTHSGMINVDETASVQYETIAEKLKDQLGYKIGVVSTVNLNHATPAAFYAHQASRNDYYEIGEEMVASGFDYFAGGAPKKVNGGGITGKDIYTQAREAGYKVVFDQADAEALTAEDGKAIVISDALADSLSMSYENDRAQGEWGLADYVKKGIEVLDNDNGFFMMVEGGKIDWACHANDAGSTIADTVALSNAVDEAIAFYNEHPTETLIIVTGDHETGGLTIGYAGTNYDTYLTNLANQKISYAKFDSEYVSGYKENQTPFEDVLADIKANFGLMTSDDPEATEDSTLVLTDYELGQIQAAYEKSMAGEEVQTDMTQEEYVMYGSYEPLTVTVTHILNNKSGISFSSYSHTGLPVPVFAMGVGEDQFKGYYDNTGIFDRTASIMGVV